MAEPLSYKLIQEDSPRQTSFELWQLFFAKFCSVTHTKLAVSSRVYTQLDTPDVQLFYLKALCHRKNTSSIVFFFLGAGGCVIVATRKKKIVAER